MADKISALLEALRNMLPNMGAKAQAEEILAGLSPDQRRRFDAYQRDVWKNQFQNQMPQDLQRKRTTALPPEIAEAMPEYAPYVSKMPMIDQEIERALNIPTKRPQAVELPQAKGERYKGFDKQTGFEFTPGGATPQVFPDALVQGARGGYNGAKYGPVAPIRNTDMPFMKELLRPDPAEQMVTEAIDNPEGEP